MSEMGVAESPVVRRSRLRVLSMSARLNIAAWVMVVAVVAIDYVWMGRSGFALTPGSIGRYGLAPLVLGILTVVLRAVAFAPRYSSLAVRLHVREGCAIAEALALIVLFTYGTLILQYLCVSLGPPVIDNILVSLDASLGFHWPDLYSWQMRHPLASFLLAKIYMSYPSQVVLTIVVLGVAKRIDDLAEFVILFMASVVTVILVSTPFPATNPMIHFGIYGPHQESPWLHFYSLREGGMRIFDLSNGEGLISMPSLHAADAVLFAYAVRNIRWIFPVSFLLNAAMVYSAIPFGAHYLVDIVAGLLLAGGLITVVRGWRANAAAQITR